MRPSVEIIHLMLKKPFIQEAQLINSQPDTHLCAFFLFFQAIFLQCFMAPAAASNW